MQKLLKLILILIIMIVQSCTHSDVRRPEIKKDVLIDVLVDIHLTDGYLTQRGFRIDRQREKIDCAYGYVLNKYDITPKQFMNTMKYYSYHADAYEQIYNKVIEKLTRMESDQNNTSTNTRQSSQKSKSKGTGQKSK